MKKQKTWKEGFVGLKMKRKSKMKKLLTLFFLTLVLTSFGQNDIPPPPVLDDNGELMDSICYVPDVQAYLGDGPEYLGKYLMINLTYPEDCIEQNIQGKVHVSFLVETDGSLSHIKVTKKVHPSLDAEALRIVNKMPKWNPALKNGKAVRTQVTVPFDFKIY